MRRGGVLRFSGQYQGASFSELLDVDHKHLRPDWAEMTNDFDRGLIPHGTTVLGFIYDSGVVIAGDRLATMGHRVASRDMQKVYATDDYSMIAIAGAAGPAVEMARLMRIELEHYEKIEGESLELEGKANKLSQMVRQNLPAAMQGFMVVPLFAGYDKRRRVGRLWGYDMTGGRYEETNYQATGSGGLYAAESLKKSHRNEIDRSGALRIAIEALVDASDEDRATGGPDVMRGIYPIINFCSDAGIERASEADIERIYREYVEQRTVRNGGAS
jgi:proteasome beta subunit